VVQSTLGQLIAHSRSLNRMESAQGILSTLLGRIFRRDINHTRALRVKQEGDAVGSLINDVTWVRKTLARLFEVRHILVHELPGKKPHALEEVVEFIDAATIFYYATDEELTSRLAGRYPLTQAEITRAAREQREVVELEELG
jgi:hypothetical protein